MARSPMTLRYQISVVLLLSALNGIVLLAAVIAFLTAPAAQPQDLYLESSLLLVWVLGVTGATLFAAYRVRSLLSQPLFELAGRAQDIANGDLTQPFPQARGGVELQALGEALESMRTHLVESLDKAEDQAQVVKTMLNALDNGVILLDERQQVVDYNPGAAEAYRLLCDAQLQRGHRVDGLADPADFGPVTTRRSVDTQDATGAQRHYLVALKPLRSQGHVLVLSDITDRMRVEALQREFLSVVTHELKTPLTSVQGYIRLLLMGKGGPLNDKQVKLLTRSKDQAEVLYRMVQDLLDATRLEGGHLTLTPQALGVRAAIDEVVANFQGTAAEKGLSLSGSDRLPAGQRVHADPFRLQQILGNLVRNAIKFTPAGGSVEVHAEVDDGELLLSVRDTGRGIPAPALDRLFEKFYQVEHGDRRRSGGAGLGLYICRQLAQAMGGRMGVRSAVGKGSTFTLRLPLAAVETE
ncbi:MAG: ATP-binding protein [Myxococcota bacterium]|nr:ATP-binding protein [Myxococcota bacterium]